MLFVSVLASVVLIAGISFLAPNLPFNNLLGGAFYQVVSILLAIVISAFLNMPMIYMARGNSAYKKRRYKDALAMYEKAFKTKRLSADMAIYCGYIFLKEGNREKCEEIFKFAENKKLTPRQKDSFDTNMALLLWKKGQLDEGVKLLGEVWERAESVTVAGSLGALMLVGAEGNEDYEKIIEFCSTANEKFTYERTIMANLGEAYYMAGRNDEALEVFGELMDCGTSAPAPFYYYALALEKAGRTEEAVDMLELSLRQRFSNLSTVSKKTVKAKKEELENFA